jgi:membrane protease YdiL (CAAX protease family)
MLPRTLIEHRWFQAVSVTAGICEELLFRGFLMWALRPWLGLWGAFAATSILFGLGHSYQGRRGLLNSTVIGMVLGALALLTGSILPGMILHALVDLSSGSIGYAALRDEASGESARPPLHMASAS